MVDRGVNQGTTYWTLVEGEPAVTADIAGGLQAIADADVRTLRKKTFLEHELLPALGLNDESIHEFPAHLHPLLGKGFGWRIWQYPNQFAAYLAFLGQRAHLISSYLEVGCRYGGTFAITAAYLARLNPAFKRAVAVDIITKPAMMNALARRLPIEYRQLNTNEAAFRKYMQRRRFDLILIDGDHHFTGITNDMELLHHRGRILAFHDINSIECPGTTCFWRLVKALHTPQLGSLHEFTEGYDDVPAGGPFLGIGCIDRTKAVP